MRRMHGQIAAALAVACMCTGAHAFAAQSRLAGSIAPARKIPHVVCCRPVGPHSATKMVAVDPKPAIDVKSEKPGVMRSGPRLVSVDTGTAFPEQRIQPPPRGRSSDWLKNLLSIPFSRTLNRIWAHFISVVATAVTTCLLMHFFPQSMWLVEGLSTTTHSLVGGALGLLLVFRTNSAYGLRTCVCECVCVCVHARIHHTYRIDFVIILTSLLGYFANLHAFACAPGHRPVLGITQNLVLHDQLSATVFAHGALLPLRLGSRTPSAPARRISSHSAASETR